MDAPRHIHPFAPQLHDVDAAGVLFFGHLYRHLHDAYEAYMAQIGQPLPALIAAGRIGLPIVRSEADYRQAMRHGEPLQIELRLERIGEHSFTLAYRVTDAAGALRAEAQTVHACVDGASGRSIPLPDRLAAALRAGTAAQPHPPNG